MLDDSHGRPQSSLTPASLMESMTALTFPWYFCSFFKNTETAGMPRSSKRSPSSFPILAAAATSRVEPMLGLSNFSCELADTVTSAVGVWMTWALTCLSVICIFSTYGLRKPRILGGLTIGITISVVAMTCKDQEGLGSRNQNNIRV